MQPADQQRSQHATHPVVTKGEPQHQHRDQPLRAPRHRIYPLPARAPPPGRGLRDFGVAPSGLNAGVLHSPDQLGISGYKVQL